MPRLFAGDAIMPSRSATNWSGSSTNTCHRRQPFFARPSMSAATYEMAPLRNAPEGYTVVMVEGMKSRMPVWIRKLRDGDLPPLMLATNIDSSALCCAMDKMLERRKPRLGPTFDASTEIVCRVIVRCEDADITSLVAEACDGVTHLAALNRLLNLPRVDEDEWQRCYHWLPNEDGDCNLLSDTENPAVRTLIEQHDQHYVWSQMDDADSDGYLVLPGYWRDAARPSCATIGAAGDGA